MPTATWNATVLADAPAADIVVVEGNVYFPRAAVRAECLTPSDTTTVCPWKGTAHYHHVTTADGKVNRDAAWYYPEPKAAAAEIRDRIAFWKGIAVER